MFNDNVRELKHKMLYICMPFPSFYFSKTWLASQSVIYFKLIVKHVWMKRNYRYKTYLLIYNSSRLYAGICP